MSELTHDLVLRTPATSPSAVVLRTPATSPSAVVNNRKGEAFIRRVVDGPVLVADSQVDAFTANIRELVMHEDFAKMQPGYIVADDEEFWTDDDYMAQRYRPYSVKNGVLTIPVMGSLVNRMSYQMGRYATGYEYIQRAVERGMADSNVESILFHVDSPGGQAAGNFELVEFIAAQRGQKPMVAVVQDHALSGGFSIASAADEIVTTTSGATGSVGVVVMHVDFSEMLSDFGVKVTFVKAGKHKTDGNSFEPLSEDAKKRMQAGVDKLYGTFVSTVAKNRGMSEDAVKGTEALVYDAEESIEVGFADRIGDLRLETAALSRREYGEKTMTTKQTATPEPTTKSVDTAKIAADARAEERKRFATVQASEHYAGREALASKFLNETEMSAEQIVSFLADSPKAEAPKTEAEPTTEAQPPRNHFAEAMDKNGSPNVGGVDEGDGDADEMIDGRPAASVSILSAYRAGGGRVRSAS
jgi:signal peptide peptidase SppA